MNNFIKRMSFSSSPFLFPIPSLTPSSSMNETSPVCAA